MKTVTLSIAMAVVVAGSFPASAAAKPPPTRAAPLRKLVDCRAIPDAAARLACYDREVAAFDAAETAREVVVVDKQQVREARRSLFGLTLPNFKLFGGGKDDDDADRIDKIESTVAGATPAPDGWIIRLADGSVWQQIDNREPYRTPKAGLTAVVQRAALGSFMMRLNGSPGMRVRRTM